LAIVLTGTNVHDWLILALANAIEPVKGTEGATPPET
jgi:hypothetical protein